MTDDKYREAALKAADSNPKNIYDLMRPLGCWSSDDACRVVQQLVDEGHLREVRREGEFFQHRYFTRQ